MPDILDNVLDELRAEYEFNDSMDGEILEKIETYKAIEDGVSDALVGEGISNGVKEKIIGKSVKNIIINMEENLT